MADYTTTKLNADSHLLLEQPLLRLPQEISRKNFKLIQRAYERDKEHVEEDLKKAGNASLAGQESAQSLASLDTMIVRMQNLKRKMENIHEEERQRYRHSKQRIKHLQELYAIPSLADKKYDDWSKVRLNRLLVDYLLRGGFLESAKALAEQKGIQELVDVDVFAQCHQIEQSLRNGSTLEALVWCSDHKASIKKINVSSIQTSEQSSLIERMKNDLEFQLRLQHYIELRRSGLVAEARNHAQRYLAGHSETHLSDIYHIAGLLIYSPDTQLEPYKSMYSPDRWNYLAGLFRKIHHTLFSIPLDPLLHIALSAGLSALKTPACHSSLASSSSNARSATTSLCPICSIELNELAKGLPYAHHTKSYVENDPVVLPNGRVYGRERLLQMSSKVGLGEDRVRDPTTGEEFDSSKVRKVFIS